MDEEVECNINCEKILTNIKPRSREVLLSNEAREVKTSFHFRASDDNKEVDTPSRLVGTAEPRGSRACPGVSTDLFML